MDMISRAAAIEEIARRDTTNGTVKVYSGHEVNAILSELPAVDAVPVRHGRWMGRRYDFKEYKYVIVPYDVTTFDNPDDLFCSVCNEPALSNGAENDVPSNYCPNCGAKMDGERRDEESCMT